MSRLKRLTRPQESQTELAGSQLGTPEPSSCDTQAQRETRETTVDPQPQGSAEQKKPIRGSQRVYRWDCGAVFTSSQAKAAHVRWSCQGKPMSLLDKAKALVGLKD